MRRMFKFALMAFAIIALIVQFGPKPEAVTPHAVPTVMVPYTSGEIVVDLIDGASESDLDAVGDWIDSELRWTHPEARDEAIAIGYVTDLSSAINSLQGNPLVEVVEPRMTMRTTGFLVKSDFPNDPLYEKQWHLGAMGAPAGWQSTPMGKGVIVAVIDTGVSLVEDLDKSRVLEGKSFTGEPQKDGNGHGTHVAGTIAQSTNNGIGVAGVAPNATILPVKVLTDQGWGNSDWIAAGIDYAVDEGAQVINLSLGGGYSQVIHNAVKKAADKGVLVFAACGNSAVNRCGYPGGLKESIGVSATGPTGKLAFYSSYGKGVDIAAPGGDKKHEGGGVWQNTIVRGKQDYYDFQGTSMATPHAAGAAAVLLSTGMDSATVEKTMLETADGDGWSEKFGHGQLNLKAALGQTSSVEKYDSVVLSVASLTFSGLLAWLAVSGRRFAVVTAVTAVFFASGLWFLPLLPLPEHVLFDVLAAPFLIWPNILLGGVFTNTPVWISAIPAGALAFIFGAHKFYRPVVAGLLVGTGTHLLWGAATATLTPVMIPFGLASWWLTVNASACALFAMGLAGVEKIEKDSE